MEQFVHFNNFDAVASIAEELADLVNSGKTLDSHTPVAYHGSTHRLQQFTKKWNEYSTIGTNKLNDPDYFARASLSKGANNSYEVTLELFENAFPEETITLRLGEEGDAESELYDAILIFCSSKSVSSGSEDVYVNPN